MDTHKSGKTFLFLWRICRIGISLFNFNRSTELCDLPTSTKFQQGRLNASDKDCNFDNSLTTCFVILFPIFIIFVISIFVRYFIIVLKIYTLFLKELILSFWKKLQSLSTFLLLINSNILNITLVFIFLQKINPRYRFYSTKSFHSKFL